MWCQGSFALFRCLLLAWHCQGQQNNGSRESETDARETTQLNKLFKADSWSVTKSPSFNSLVRELSYSTTGWNQSWLVIKSMICERGVKLIVGELCFHFWCCIFFLCIWGRENATSVVPIKQSIVSIVGIICTPAYCWQNKNCPAYNKISLFFCLFYCRWNYE